MLWDYYSIRRDRMVKLAGGGEPKEVLGATFISFKDTECILFASIPSILDSRLG